MRHVVVVWDQEITGSDPSVIRQSLISKATAKAGAAPALPGVKYLTRPAAGGQGTIVEWQTPDAS